MGASEALLLLEAAPEVRQHRLRQLLHQLQPGAQGCHRRALRLQPQESLGHKASLQASTRRCTLKAYMLGQCDRRDDITVATS